MSAIRSLVAAAAECLSLGRSQPFSAESQNLEAMAHLMHADLELRLEERDERRRGMAAEVARDLQKILGNNARVGHVVATADGLGFVIGGFGDGVGGNSREVARTWEVTETYRSAGWLVEFAFSNSAASSCSRHTPMDGLPFCRICGRDPGRTR